MEEKNVLLRLKPKFNFIYEMFMPTGRRIRNTLFALIFVIVAYYFLNIAVNSINVGTDIEFDYKDVFNKVSIVIIAITVVKLLAHIIAKLLEYNGITYTFYDDCLEYEDSFLNQHKKTVRYANVKEVEIRRTVWDRMNGYGMIVIYSNAEKNIGDGLIIYGIKNIDKIYIQIDKIIHDNSKLEVVNENVKHTEDSDIESKEQAFRESLNNKEER